MSQEIVSSPFFSSAITVLEATACLDTALCIGSTATPVSFDYRCWRCCNLYNLKEMKQTSVDVNDVPADP